MFLQRIQWVEGWMLGPGILDLGLDTSHKLSLAEFALGGLR